MTPLERARAVYALRGLAPAPKAVLACLAHHDGATCRPGRALLADETGFSVVTVSRALNELKARGLIRQQRRRRAAAVYEIDYAAVARGVSMTPLKRCKRCHCEIKMYHSECKKCQSDTSDNKESTRKRTRKRTGKARAREGRIYSTWQGHHPRAPAAPSPKALEACQRLLKEVEGEAAALLVLRWVHECPDLWPRRIRGEAPWPGGEVVRRWDLVSIARLSPRWLPQAQAWAEEGQAAAVRAAAPPWEEPMVPGVRQKRTDDAAFALDFIEAQAFALAEVRARIREAGGGWLELRRWLTPRVTHPDLVLTHLRASQALSPDLGSPQ